MTDPQGAEKAWNKWLEHEDNCTIECSREIFLAGYASGMASRDGLRKALEDFGDHALKKCLLEPRPDECFVCKAIAEDEKDL